MGISKHEDDFGQAEIQETPTDQKENDPSKEVVNILNIDDFLNGQEYKDHKRDDF